MADLSPQVSELPDKGPAENASLTTNEGIDAIADLLDDLGNDLPPDNVDGHEDPAAEASTFDEDDQPSEAVDDVADQDDDEPQETYDGGKFAADKANITLPDGSVITVAEVKSGYMRQRDYSKKTAELAREKETVEKRSSEVDQTHQQTKQERDYLLWFAQKYAPQPPTPPTLDESRVNPMAEVEYAARIREYNVLATEYHQMLQQKQADEERIAGETAQQKHARLAQEAERTKARYPVLNDPVKAPRFWQETAQGAEQFYGLDLNAMQERLQTKEDVEILRDAIAYRRGKAMSAKAVKEVAQKPRIVTGNPRRIGPTAQATKSRQENTDRLKQTGSLKDGIAALMDMNDL